MENIDPIENHKPAPNFNLQDINDQSHALSDYLGSIVILNFWSAECTWSKRADELIAQYLLEWGDRVQYLPVASNLNEDREILVAQAATRKLDLLLKDEKNRVANLYGATSTPHIFVIDTGGVLRYQGAFDDVTFRQRTPGEHYLYLAVKSLLRDQLPDPDLTPAYGCTIVRAAAS